MQGQFLIIGSIVLVSIILIIVIVQCIKKARLKYYRNKVKDLEILRNQVASTPVPLELSKVEPIIKNDMLEDKFNKWNDRFAEIKENRITLIDDMLLDLDEVVDNKDYKQCRISMAKVEIEIYKVRESAEHLLEEIKDITLSEEKYRSIVTKLKTKYRNLTNIFNKNPEMYGEVKEPINLQLENIERKFNEFEKVMDSNEYNEVVHVCKALDTMIEHIEIVINEVPDILLMIEQVIPNRMREVEINYNELNERGFPLDYLNIEYNIEESKKTLDSILEKTKLLNLEGSMFDLSTMLEYYDSLFIDFEKERLSRKIYDEIKKDFALRIDKTNKLVNDLFEQLEDIKNMYDLNEEDLNIIHDVNKVLVVINDDYKKMISMEENKSIPYSKLNEDIEDLTNRLSVMEDDFDIALKSLGNLYDDEVRAREQLVELDNFLRDSKLKMRSFKLPVINDSYYVQLQEAYEAIDEVQNELNKKPIVMMTLNTRVDTARDLVLKLYNTTEDIIRTAKIAEYSIMYGNRYRNKYTDIEKGLINAEHYFNMGNYKKSLELSIKSISLVDDNFKRKLSNKFQ